MAGLLRRNRRGTGEEPGEGIRSVIGPAQICLHFASFVHRATPFRKELALDEYFVNQASRAAGQSSQVSNREPFLLY